jgi:hypothetical protein
VQIGDPGATGESQARITPEARRHVLFDPTVPGAPALEAWDDLPPVALAAGIGPAKGAAEAFMLAPLGGETVPVLSWNRAGQGRVLLVAAGGVWRWDFSSASSRPEGNVMPGWWRRTAHWLARPDLATRLDVHPEEHVVPRGKGVGFVARVTDETYQPVPGVTVEVDVAPAAGGDPTRITLGGDDGFFSGLVERLPPGRYDYVGRARKDAQSLGTVEGTFAVDSLGTEMERLEADHELLGRIASTSGGRLWLPDSLDTLRDQFRSLDEAEEERVQVAIWDHPIIFALFVIFASTEWLLRRRRGLV